MNGTSSLTRSGEMSSAGSMPHDFDDVIRRVSSCIRSGVRATSMPPVIVKTPSSSYWRTRVERERRHLLRVVGQEDEVGGVTRRSARARQRALLEQHDVPPAEAREVPGHAVADDPGADDDDPRLARQPSHVFLQLAPVDPGPPAGPQARFTTIVLSSVRRSIENRPPTRPRPLCEPARPPNGQVRFPVVRAFVDVDPSGASRLGEPQPARQVAREHGGQEAVRRRAR